MYFKTDKRTPLQPGTEVVIMTKNTVYEYVIDSLAGSGGIALMYIAHEKSNPYHYVALKELFPRALDNAVAERKDDNRIVISYLLKRKDTQDDSPIWDQLIPYFDREVQLTEKASAIYDSDGKRMTQNNPDVFGVSGPFVAENGNRYIVIDTKAGKSLQHFIDNGWENASDKGTYRNNLLGDIIDLMIKVTQRLSALHGDQRILHLDLSPTNIYVSCINGGQEFEPTIIDYGSAYDRNDPNLNAHRFTCNPYSSPEINVLAELNDQNAGYYPDVTSDTYSITAILFYAVLGELYSVTKKYDSSWREKIRVLYPETVYGDFAENLIDFFCQGLSANQTERYVTIQPSINRLQDSLLDALLKLKKEYKEADILNAMSENNADELMSYLILDKYPLYRYISSNKNIHVLCLGSGAFVNRMILSILGTGQMVGHKLYIHIVSSDADSYKLRLLEQAPLLEKYADFGDDTVSDENKFVTFTFQNVVDLTDEAMCRKVAEDYGNICRYVVISLGANNNNITLARRFASEIGKISKAKTLINYYMSEDYASNVRADIEESVIPSHVEVIPFGNKLSSYNKDVHTLGLKAFRVSYLYEKSYNKRVTKDQAFKTFLSDIYRQRSSTAAAVHVDYKLVCLGINVTDPKISHKSKASYQDKIISSYTHCLQDDEKYNQLLQLEHIRWMLFMIADGYRLPTERDHEMYSFRMVGKTFNKAFKCTDDTIKTHHCLVPCSAEGIQLPSDHNEWDKYSSADEIWNSHYDELDKMSLYVHFLAKQRIERSSTIGKIESIVKYDLFDRLYLAPGKEELKKEYESFKTFILQLLQHKSTEKLEEKLGHIQEQFSVCDIDISDIITLLKNQLAIFVEFNAYKDYKVSDKTIIENLLWIRFNDDIIMIKAAANSALSNIAAPLIIEPQQVIYLGMGAQSQQHITQFFEERNTEVFFESCNFDNLEKIITLLNGLTQNTNYNNYVIDVTDSNPFFVSAAVIAAEKNKKIGVISCNTEDFSVRNILNYPCASIYHLNTSLSADDVFGLYGAKSKEFTDNYMLRLRPYMDKLWQFYNNHSDSWEMISSFFEAFGTGSSEFHISDLNVNNDKTGTFKRQVSSIICEKTGIFDILTKMQKCGIISDFSHEQWEAYTNISFSYPIMAQGRSNNVFSQKFTDLLNNLGDVYLECTIKPKQNNMFDIDIMSGLKVFRKSGKFTNKDKSKEFDIAAMEAILKELEQLQMISSLVFKVIDDSTQVSFIYNSSAIRDCLTTAGNILEAYVWYEADKTGFFDSLQTNFSFNWSNPNVSNELDVILTHGLTTLLCSCKTAKFNKEHLYEIADLANRFSVNTKPVIIYSSDKMVENGKISHSTDAVRERAKAMGIYLIDRETLNHDLGAELVRIANDSKN